MLLGFRAAWARYTSRTGKQHVSIGRGRRYAFEVGYTRALDRFFVLSGGQLAKALWCSLQQRFALYGGVAFIQDGIPTGGITSRPALSLALGHMEAQSRIPAFGKKTFWAVRYVDDVFSVAGGLCPACVERTIQHVYGTLFTRAGEKDGWTTWLEQELRVVGDAVVRRFRHGAREWVAGRALRPDRPTFLPYLGALPSSFAVIRGIVCGRLKRLHTLQCGGAEIVQVLLETHLELVLLGYPVSFVRAVAHSLSKSPAVCVRSDPGARHAGPPIQCAHRAWRSTGGALCAAGAWRRASQRPAGWEARAGRQLVLVEQRVGGLSRLQGREGPREARTRLPSAGGGACSRAR